MKYRGWMIIAFALFAVVACGGGGGDDKTVKLYGVTNGETSASDSVLVLLSPDDGSFVSTIGPVGYRLTGLEYVEASNKLYGTTHRNDPLFPNGLIEIDMDSGVAATIGSAGTNIVMLTSNSNGDLFAWSPWDSANCLMTVDSMTGVAVTLGDIGFEVYEHGLAFDSSDTLYMVNGETVGGTGGNIYTLDTATGSATYIGVTGQKAHHGDVDPVTGLYWGIDSTSDEATAKNLVVIDLNTSAVLNTRPTIDRLHAVSFYYH